MTELAASNRVAGQIIRSEQSDRHLFVSWHGARPCLSSAPHNGGYCLANGVLNLRVDGCDARHPPEATLQQYADARGWHGVTVGLMTAAGMDTLRYRSDSHQGETLELWLTCGLDNARRAGDPADWHGEASPPPGTINALFATSLTLSQATMAEMLMVLTEAKCAVLQDAGITSPVSGGIATGTGTDALAVVAGYGAPERWAGKHTLLGQKAAQLMKTALRASIDGQP